MGGPSCVDARDPINPQSPAVQKAPQQALRSFPMFDEIKHVLALFIGGILSEAELCDYLAGIEQENLSQIFGEEGW